MFLSINNIYAEEVIIRKHRLSNAFGVFEAADRTRLFYAESYSFNGQIVYCIEPGTAVSATTYTITDDLSKANLNEALLNKIRLIAYYGFSYNNGPNNNDRYYMASQELIWEEISGRESYWVYDEDINGTRINVEAEKNQILSSIANHYTLPSFNNQTITVKVGETYRLVDEANVLSKFQLDNETDNIKINNNYLEITPKSLSDAQTITLTSKSYTDKVPYIYYSGASQKMISATGKVEPLKVSVKLNVIVTPQIKIIKTDALTNKRVKISGIKFKIKNLANNEYVCDNSNCIYETNENGEVLTSSKLSYGNYQIEEIDQSIKGYQVNKEPLKFSISGNSNYQTTNDITYLEFNFKNTPILGKIILNKLGETFSFEDNLINYSFSPLDKVTFNLYAKNDIYNPSGELKYRKDTLIKTITTSNGKANIDSLPLGDYYIVETSAPSEYLVPETKYELSLTNQENAKEITIENYLKKGTFELTKIDNKTALPLAGAEITLYNENDEIIIISKTDEFGRITISDLPLGKYYYIETIAPDNYQIDSTKNYFELKENNEIYNADFINEKIPVPNTNLNRYNLLNLISLIIFITGGISLGYTKN